MKLDSEVEYENQFLMYNSQRPRWWFYSGYYNRENVHQWETSQGGGRKGKTSIEQRKQCDIQHL